MTKRPNNSFQSYQANSRSTLLSDVLVVKTPKIKVCNTFPFRKTCFVTLLRKQSHVLFEITFYLFIFVFVFVFLLLSHICSYGPNLFICALIMFLNRNFLSEWFKRFLRFLWSLIKNKATVRKCYLFSCRYKNVWDIGICLKPHFDSKVNNSKTLRQIFL